MSQTVPSLADEECIREYTSTDSHVFAVALHRLFEWKMLVVTAAGEPFWTGAGEGEQDIPTVVHVYGLDPSGDVWDIRGRRSREAVRDDMYEVFNAQDFEEDVCADEDELAFYVGVWSETGDPVERPLSTYTNEDIERAKDIMDRLFPSIPMGLASHSISNGI